MNYVSLSDEETRVVFAEEAAEIFAELDSSEQQDVINRLLNIVSSDAPPSAFIHEHSANLDIIAVGDQCGLYTKVVDEIPRGDTEYHVIFLFFIDPYHDYPDKALAQYNSRAEARVEEVTGLETVDDVEQYLDDLDALDESALEELL